MRINHKILSIPPYISTSWKNITSLHCEYREEVLVLVVGLNNGTRIEIPQLEASAIEAIFAAHSKFLEQDQTGISQKNHPVPRPSFQAPGNGSPSNEPSSFPSGVPFLQIGPAGIENFGSVLQHNPEMSNAPDLPKEMLNKIASISKAVGIDDPNLLPKPEPHCNCFHCQISRAIQLADEGEQPPAENAVEEVVSDEDLKFRLWDVAQTSDKLYLVSNPMDSKEHYSVFLGEPIGCTCGEKNCEHVRAVLNS
ncbi:MAG TPA: hypothetical protein VLG49_00440 [Rhabdochlamydiaceae bacterium]|nr:hypothetical protein [Rhabdochlamydiaceae bacterium]